MRALRSVCSRLGVSDCGRHPCRGREHQRNSQRDESHRRRQPARRRRDVHHDDDSMHPVRRAKYRAAAERVHHHGSSESGRHDDLSADLRPTVSDGISNGTSAANSQPGVQIIGPGMVQKFRRHGILIVGAAGVSTNVTIKHVTSHHNCFSGLLTNGMTDSVIEGIVSVRNAANSGAPPCGGNCLVNSNNNHIVNNLFGGNGSVCAAALCAAAPTVASNNDFGVGLIGTSSGNLIEDNSITGNSNGILIQTGASGNTIRQNIAAGNPPSQVSRTVRSDRIRHQGRSADERRAQHVRQELVHLLCGTGTVALSEFSRGRASDDLGADGHSKRPLASERANGVGEHRRDGDRRQRSSPACQITGVTSNEPLGASDWSLTGPLSLNLRADRNGLGPGRIYSITVKCTNVSQLSASAEVSVLVPHDRR